MQLKQELSDGARYWFSAEEEEEPPRAQPHLPAPNKKYGKQLESLKF